jgi:exodeoxyribonuclease VII large subunit
LADAGRRGANIAEFSVSELSSAIRRALEDGFGFVRLRGEISGFRGPHSSGHCYFALKDDKAKIEAVIWRSSVPRLKCKPAEGLEVIATGRVTTYPGSSKYQIVVEMLEPAGIGALMALLEERKQKLAAEGLFGEERKRKLPYLPKVVGIITSPTGAVIRDMLHGFRERFPTHVVVWPVRVQGETCAAEVAAAIAGFNAIEPAAAVPRPDVLIVARGGGSLEDLWGFNEEAVARAAAASRIPLISAIGHETDWTLIDLVADARAPTPTKAAEWAVPKHADLVEQTAEYAVRTRRAGRRVLESARRDLRSAARGLPQLEKLLALPRQRLDSAEKSLRSALLGNTQAHAKRLARAAPRLQPHLLEQRIERAHARADRALRRGAQALSRYAGTRRARLERLFGRLSVRPIAHRVERCRERTHALGARLQQCFAARTRQRRQMLSGQAQMLASLSYQSVLQRGFALVRDEQGRAVRSARGVAAGQRLDIELGDGRLEAEVRASAAPEQREAAAGSDGGTASSKPRAVGRKAPRGQGSLFD